jgi:hypothetical protein
MNEQTEEEEEQQFGDDDDDGHEDNDRGDEKKLDNDMYYDLDESRFEDRPSNVNIAEPTGMICFSIIESPPRTYFCYCLLGLLSAAFSFTNSAYHPRNLHYAITHFEY